MIVDKSWRQVSQITDRNVILVNDRPELLQQHLGVWAACASARRHGARRTALL